MTDEEHNKYIAWAFIAHGVFQVLILGAFTVFFGLFFIANQDPEFPARIFGVIFGIAILFNLILISPDFIAAYALLKRKSWARVMTIVASVLAVFSVPTGTLAGVYALWFFVGDRWRSIYEPERNSNVGFSLNSGIPDQKWEGRFVNENGEEVYRQPDIPDWR